MNKDILNELADYGQSIWLDNINRKMIETGKLKEMIDSGLRGMTSNPSIFDKAISKTDDYDKYIEKLGPSDKSTFEIYDELTVKDIQDAANLFRPVYEKTNGLDGYVSLEINPKLAFDVDKTIAEGKRLFKKVNRPNLMLKVPATDQGFDAVSELIGAGMNVNVTLIFSLEKYKKTTMAYIDGLKRLLRNGGDLAKVRSVASVFVSRVDSSVDKQLDEFLSKENEKKDLLSSLKGKAAVANSQLIYSEFMKIFLSKDYESLKAKGANIQKALWASTSTKNPEYSDIKYVEELIGKDTVNTLPGNTLELFLDHGQVKEALTGDDGAAKKIINDFKAIGIDINDVCDKLLQDGVQAFINSFESLLESIEEKAKAIAG